MHLFAWFRFQSTWPYSHVVKSVYSLLLDSEHSKWYTCFFVQSSGAPQGSTVQNIMEKMGKDMQIRWLYMQYQHYGCPLWVKIAIRILGFYGKNRWCPVPPCQDLYQSVPPLEAWVGTDPGKEEQGVRDSMNLMSPCQDLHGLSLLTEMHL